MFLGWVGLVLLVFLAQQVIPVGVFAVICLATRFTGTFKHGLVSFGSGVGTSLEDLFGEDFGGDGRQRGNSSLQVISAKIVMSETQKQDNRSSNSRGLPPPASPELKSHSLPVTLHVSLLKIDIAVGDLTRVARVRMRTRGLPRGGGLDARHGEKNSVGPVAIGLLTDRVCRVGVIGSSSPYKAPEASMRDSTAGDVLQELLILVEVFEWRGHLTYYLASACQGWVVPCICIFLQAM